jgi:hypothetical protein
MAASLPMAVNVAMANTVTLYQGSYSYSVGGEFTAIASPDLLGNGYVLSTEQAVSGHGTGFQTFCLETGVTFSPGTQYYYTLGTTTQPLSGGGAGSGLNLTAGAAYLYYEFATGQLAGYNYANSGPGLSRLDDAGLLQAAIWYLQGNQTYGGYVTPTISNDPFYALALANANSSYLSYVDVLQMWTTDNNGVYSGPAQNQLVLTGTRPPPSPVPDGGMTIVLLGGALAGLQALRRKLVA